MRIGVAQVNPTLGDFKNNKEKIIEYVNRAKDMKCSLVVFPECSLFGYHPFDLLERAEAVESQEKELSDLQKKIPEGMAVIVGLITKNKNKRGRPYHNSAALLINGKKPRIFNKELLPTGDVFDEARFIESGDVSKNFFSFGGKKFFLTICEDIWAWDYSVRTPYEENPLKKVKKQRLDMVINISASPFFLGKMKLREKVTQATAKHFKAPVLYTNMVGAQDEIIYDGQSFIINPKGKKLFTCEAFEEDLNVYDLESHESWRTPKELSQTEQLRKALVLGIQDFCRKTGLEKVHFGLSGGIDSAVVACLAVDALGPSKVACFGLPGPFSSAESLILAEKLAKNLNITMMKIPISEAYESTLKTFSEVTGYNEFTVLNENLQARLRGLFMMMYSNKENSLLLTTANKSEMASGYATLYGDMCGGLAPISDLTKNQVYELAHYYNSQTEIIPKDIIERHPSAELRPNQKDQDTLPPYEELDKAVVHIVENQGRTKKETEKWLLKRLFASEFKRWQAAPILKVSAHSFGRGRRFPVAHKTLSNT
jgi:NAD+ synthase (glutamine-hydrolysing)